MECVPSKDEFRSLARGANIIPVYREIIADIDTPVSALAKLGNGPTTFLLESVEGGDRLDRYSFLGNSARITFQASGNEVTWGYDDGSIHKKTTSHPLSLLQ